MPLSGFGTPEGIAATIAYVASDEASHMNGADIRVRRRHPVLTCAAPPGRSRRGVHQLPSVERPSVAHHSAVSLMPAIEARGISSSNERL